MTSIQPLTRRLGAFVSQCGFSSLPEAAVRTAKLGLTDATGVMIAGGGEAAAEIVARTLADEGTEASLLLGSRRSGAVAASVVNGTAAHALDYDDVANQGHPSAVLLPAILAEAEAIGASGRDVITAYVAGYEVWAELVLREPDQHHRRGWHPTGIFGAVGAAAACANLLGLSAAQAAHALALAASQSAGLMVNFGSMAKPFHAGRAAQAGLVSARLAAAGMTGSTDALENARGLLHAVSPGGRVDLHSPILAGRDWHIIRRGLVIKNYPTCLSTHRAIEATLQIRERGALSLKDVRSATVSMSRRNAEILHSHRPKTALEGKFSAEFAVAAALVAGKLTLEELTDEFVLRRDIQDFIPNVSLIHDEREDPATGYAPEDVVVIETADGSRLGAKVSALLGSPERPLSGEKLWQKFSGCLAAVRSGLPARALFDMLQSLETLADIRKLASCRMEVT